MMKAVKTYKNTLASFKKWCRDHVWNSKYESDKEFFTHNGLYYELSLNDFSDGSLHAYVSIREYLPAQQNFRLVDKNDSRIDKEFLNQKLTAYLEKHKAVSYTI